MVFHFQLLSSWRLALLGEGWLAWPVLAAWAGEIATRSSHRPGMSRPGDFTCETRGWKYKNLETDWWNTSTWCRCLFHDRHLYLENSSYNESENQIVAAIGQLDIFNHCLSTFSYKNLTRIWQRSIVLTTNDKQSDWTGQGSFYFYFSFNLLSYLCGKCD